MLLLLAIACRPDPAPPPPPPDVVLVVIDTLRGDALGYAGAPVQSSPNLDALVAAEATWFSRAYAASSWTLSSTTTLLTGLYPFEHKVVGSNAGETTTYGRLDPAIPTLATEWKAKGYATAAWVNNAFLAPMFGLDQGFDLYDYEGAALTGHRTAAATVEQALTWRNTQQGPAFMMVHIMEPHLDYAPGEPFAGTFTAGKELPFPIPLGGELHQSWIHGTTPPPEDPELLKLAYYEEVLAADAAVGALIDGLKAQGRWDNTVFVLTSDHGEEFWDYGKFEHGHTLLTPVTNVPLIVKAPGVKAGRNDTVLDPLLVHDLLQTGDGQLTEIARSGETATGRYAVADDVVYAAPAAALRTADYTAIIQLETRQVVLHPMLDGREQPIMEASPERKALSDAMLGKLSELRGGLEPTVPHDARPIETPEVFDQLRALGYIQD